MYNQEFTIKNSYLTEIDFTQAPAAGDKIYFKDYPNLTPRNGQRIIFTGVECYYDQLLAFSPNQIAVNNLANIAKCTLTIAVGSDQKLYQIPLTNLVPFLQGGLIRKLNNLEVTLTKCYVQINQAGISANTSICFNWYYEKRKL